MPEQQVERGLTTILGADIAGFRRLIGLDETLVTCVAGCALQ